MITLTRKERDCNLGEREIGLAWCSASIEQQHLSPEGIAAAVQELDTIIEPITKKEEELSLYQHIELGGLLRDNWCKDIEPQRFAWSTVQLGKSYSTNWKK